MQSELVQSMRFGLLAGALAFALESDAHAVRIARWSFDDGTFQDAHGNYHGTRVAPAGGTLADNAVQVGTNAATLSPQGGGYLELDGNGDFLATPATPSAPANGGSASAVPASGSYTKAAWARFTGNAAGFANVFTSGDSGGGHGLLNNADGTMAVIHGSGEWFFPGVATDSGTWNHWAVSYDAAATTLRIYKNGGLIFTGTEIPAIGNQTNADNIGGYAAMQSWWQGQLDDIQLWDEALSQTQIASIRNTGELPPAEQFARWKAQFPTLPASNAADVEGDGLNTALEYGLGTHPTRPDVPPFTLSPRPGGGHFLQHTRPVDFAARGISYVVESSTALANGSWMAVSPVPAVQLVSTANGVQTVRHAIPPQTGNRRLYRVRVGW